MVSRGGIDELVADIFVRVPAHTASLALGNGGLRDLFDQACHGHLDIELDHVGHGMELRVDHWVREVHESNYHDLRRYQPRDPLSARAWCRINYLRPCRLK